MSGYSGQEILLPAPLIRPGDSTTTTTTTTTTADQATLPLFPVSPHEPIPEAISEHGREVTSTDIFLVPTAGTQPTDTSHEAATTLALAPPALQHAVEPGLTDSTPPPQTRSLTPDPVSNAPVTTVSPIAEGVGALSMEDKQAEIRRQIQAIQSAKSLSTQEKSLQMQLLLMGGLSLNQNIHNSLYKSPFLSVSQENMSAISEPLATAGANLDAAKGGLGSHLDVVIREPDREPSWQSDGVMGCAHYQRGCKIFAACCDRWFPCRFCHDAAYSTANDARASVVSSLSVLSGGHCLEGPIHVPLILCMHCGTPQKPRSQCLSCNRTFGLYFCDVCRLWENQAHKASKIYHCPEPGCASCRVGPAADFYHCKGCDCCILKSLENSHKCIDKKLHSDCPICGEWMQTSALAIIFMPCGHAIHMECYRNHIENSYQCPICLKSVLNMTEHFKQLDEALALQELPDDFKNKKNNILCNDCERRSVAPFHFIYHKCSWCCSYNTKVIQ